MWHEPHYFLTARQSLTVFPHCTPLLAIAAYAGHGINSALFPWNQPARYDTLIATQLKNVSAADRKAAADIALPVADKLLRKR